MAQHTWVIITEIAYYPDNYQKVPFRPETLKSFERLEQVPVVTSASAPYAADQQALINRWFRENFLLPKLSDFVCCTMAIVEPRRSRRIAVQEPVEYS